MWYEYNMEPLIKQITASCVVQHTSRKGLIPLYKFNDFQNHWNTKLLSEYNLPVLQGHIFFKPNLILWKQWDKWPSHSTNHTATYRCLLYQFPKHCSFIEHEACIFQDWTFHDIGYTQDNDKETCSVASSLNYLCCQLRKRVSVGRQKHAAASAWRRWSDSGKCVR